jgi:2-amino-4-hydroxy-6-hydroxymethyldihydropteridine diphosphokinase
MKAYLGLGSNLGDRLANLRKAVALLDAVDGVDVTRSSRVYESDPVGGPEDQPEFLNVVVEVDVTSDVRALLGVCIDVEREMGRVRDQRWGPRNIDVDILTFGSERVDEEDLTVPHPRMHERLFVLAPLLELDADPPLPGGRHALTMSLDRVDVSTARPFAPPLA